MLDTGERDTQRILKYLERYGLLTKDASLYVLADVLPVSFDRAMEILVNNGYVIESVAEGRRPVYYLSIDEHRTLSNLFPDKSRNSINEEAPNGS